MKKFYTQKLARAGVIAGLYIALSLITFSFSGGAIQLRISEALTLLPILYYEAIPALFIGCLLTNLITGCALPDVFLGATITLVCAILTFLFSRLVKKAYLKIIIGGAFPVLLNAFLLPLIWYYCYGELEYLYIVQVGFLTASQALSVYVLGSSMYLGLKKISV